MALYNLARMTTATTGTGTITLGAAVSGYLSFAAAGASNGETVSYGIMDGANSEVGTGIYTSAGTTLTRTVLRSTNANAAISLSGSAEVFITALAEDFAALVPLTTRGDLITRDASSNVRLGIGAPGYHVQSDGTDAAWSGFVPSGTGATARTWNAKAADLISAKDFGAVGDGSTDDTTALSNWLTAISGGFGILPAGTYMCQGLSIPSSTRIYGYGATLKKRANGSVITSMGTAAHIIGLIIAGDGGSFTGKGIQITTGNDQRLINVNVTNCQDYCLDVDNDVGLRFQWIGGTTNRTTTTNYAIRFANGGVTESNGDRTLAFINCGGANLIDTAGSQNTIIHGCDFINMSMGALSLKTVLTGNRIATLGLDLTIDGSDHSVTGNVIAGGIVINSGASRNRVYSNVMLSGSVVVDNSGATGADANTIIDQASVIPTSTRSPIIIGGAGVASTLELRATKGVGAGSEAVSVTGGNNGATPFGTFTSTKLNIPQTTASTSETTGALTAAGGIASAGRISAAATSGFGLGSGLTLYVASTNYTRIQSPGTVSSYMLIGNTSDQGIYYRANNHTFQNAAGSVTAMYFNITSADPLVGIGTLSPDRKFQVEQDSATTNAVTYVQRITSTSSGTPANGIGVGLEYEVETSASNNEVGMTLDAVATDTTSTSEDFDFVVNLMAAGATANEKFRVQSTGRLDLPTGAFSANGSVATVLGSLGPTGANTTVQKWLAIDDAGTIRYIPCF